MNIILFVVRLRIEGLFGKTNHSSIFSNVVYLLLVLIAIIYGVSFSFLLQYFQNIAGFNFQKAFFIMNLILAFSVILKGYFPQYMPFKNIFLNAYPLKLHQKAVSILIYEFLNVINVLIVIFCFTVFIFLSEYNVTQFLISLLTICIFYIIEKLLKISIVNFSQFIIGLMIVGIITSSYLYGYNILIKSEGIISILLFLILLISYSIFSLKYKWYSISEKKIYFLRLKVFSKQIESTSAWESLFKKKSLFNSLLIGFGFKMIIAAMLVVALLNKNMGLSSNSVIVALICSPVVFFNYIFNNLFGYRPQIFLYVGYNFPYKGWLRYYLKCIKNLLFFDFIISNIVLSFIHNKIELLNIFYLLFIYSTLTIYGFIASILLPKRVTNALSFTSFKSNTSLAASFIMIFFTIVSYNILGSISAFILFIFLNCIIIWCFLHFLIHKQPQKRYIAIINKIF